jgi:hypothetical protein
MPLNMSHRSRRRCTSALLILAMGFGALLAVLALPAIEHFIWPDTVQDSRR